MSASAPSAHDIAALDRALELAREAFDNDEVPVGAVIYRTDTGETIAEARNETEALADGTAHAEMLAIRRAMQRVEGKRLTGCSLVVTLEPCAMCAGAIVHARLDRVVYGASDPKAGAVESVFQLLSDTRLNHQPKVLTGVRADECGGLLIRFFRDRRNAQ